MDFGSVTRAAESMHITQSAASRLVSRLEKEVGFALFDRGLGRMVATEEGKAFHREVLRSFSGLRELTFAARRIAQIGTGTLRICVMPTLQQGELPALVATFCRAKPDISVFFDVQSHHDVVHAVARGSAELGFATLPIDEPDLRMQPIWKHAAVCLMAPEHPLARQRWVRPSDLSGVELISVPRARFHERVMQLLHEHQVQRNVRMEARTILAATELVAHGAGVCISDPFSIEALKAKRVVARPLHPKLFIEVGAFYRSRQTLSVLARQFLDHCISSSVRTSRS